MVIDIKIPSDHSVNQLYSNYIQPLNQNLFGIINERLEEIDPVWTQKKILDYGCNAGNLLRSSKGNIKENKYTGIDVQEIPLRIARADFPEANWIQYNGYHRAFNPDGTQQFPDIIEKFDYIFCIGVFQHMDISEISKTLEYFKTLLLPGGKIIFSFWERKHWLPYSTIFLPTKLKVSLPEYLFKEFKKSVYLVNRERTLFDIVDADINVCNWFEAFYDFEYFKSHFHDVVEIDRESSIHSFLML
jgi:2-polyprenyl-3-methyl-5-hydroxy-6-metoxy-1,4-benzoquinol methylase